jgi:23S rRNA (pseudouridine1915-N3)-methyltransferase
MNILILVEDRVKTPGINEGIRYFQKLCSGWAQVTLESWGKRKGHSEEAILNQAKASDYIIALDRNGIGNDCWAPDSQEFASFLNETIRGSWHRLLFVVGGPDGLPETVLQRAHRILSLSNLTFPHDMVPLLLMEQIYRGLSILNRHPYHR